MQEESAAPHPRSDARILIGLALVAATAFFGSDLLLRGSDSFWSAAAALVPAGSADGPALTLEATLRSLAPGQAKLAILGSSVVPHAIDPQQVERELGIAVPEAPLLWLPRGSPLELAMLTPRLVELRPRVVVFLATHWNLLPDVDWEGLRLWDEGFARSLLGWRELLAHHQAYAAKLLASHHVVMRHRAALREILGGPGLVAFGTAEPAWLVHNRAFERAQRTHQAEPDQLVCDNLHTRSLALMARQLGAAGTQLLVVAMPQNDRWSADARVEAEVDDCYERTGAAAGFAFFGRASQPDFAAAEFEDEGHLASNGREKFTHTLVDRLRALGGSPHALR